MPFNFVANIADSRWPNKKKTRFYPNFASVLSAFRFYCAQRIPQANDLRRFSFWFRLSANRSLATPSLITSAMLQWTSVCGARRLLSSFGAYASYLYMYLEWGKLRRTNIIQSMFIKTTTRTFKNASMPTVLDGDALFGFLLIFESCACHAECLLCMYWSVQPTGNFTQKNMNIAKSFSGKNLQWWMIRLIIVPTQSVPIVQFACDCLCCRIPSLVVRLILI